MTIINNNGRDSSLFTTVAVFAGGASAGDLLLSQLGFKELTAGINMRFGLGLSVFSTSNPSNPFSSRLQHSFPPPDKCVLTYYGVHHFGASRCRLCDCQSGPRPAGQSNRLRLVPFDSPAHVGLSPLPLPVSFGQEIRTHPDGLIPDSLADIGSPSAFDPIFVMAFVSGA